MLSGGVLLHRMLSVIPAEIGAQATSVAVRVASCDVGARATLQLVSPSKVMHTSQEYCCSPIVE